MPITPDLLKNIDDVRRRLGFLSVAETLQLNELGNTIVDPFSTLIGRQVQIGHGNLFYPAVTIECSGEGSVLIGSNNTFHSGTRIQSENGVVEIGDDNQFGDGGFIARSNRSAAIKIGNGGRYTSGATIVGNTALGSGSQVLGPITVENCELGEGETFAHPDPDLRAAVLKGQGRARGIKISAGEVIAGQGPFDPGSVQRQTDFHPKIAPE
ncbi:MAG: hypothetical protein ABJN26_01390 [Stappiaceae bacterium]